MPMATNLRSLDLNLLTVFEAVFETGSIIRAADRLALSQSATSHALSRLREACGDDLFVRVGQGIVPTPVAQRIYPEIKKSLDGLRQSISEARGFDPGTSTRRFQIAIPHPMGPLWALALHDAAVAEAPGVVLSFDTRTLADSAGEHMHGGELDLCVDWYPPGGDRFVLRKLYEDGYILVARKGHPRASPGMSADAIRREKFVATRYRSGTPPEPIRMLRQAIIDLDFGVEVLVSEFLEMPFVVMQTDLIGFIAKSMKGPAVEAAGLQVIGDVVPSLTIPIYLVWHETRRADDGHRWLRELVAQTVIAAIKR
jgi:DNA-binding transcriptional LysR family regulator